MLGHCVKGAGCWKRHDFTRTALCPSVLTDRECNPSGGDVCRLQHVGSSETLPSCFYFLNGRCLRSGCPFSHSPVDLDFLVCPDFGLLGYCERGLGCRLSHLRWCSDFSNSGQCRKARCALQHRKHGGFAMWRDKSPKAGRHAQEQYTTGFRTNDFSAQQDYVSLE